MLRRRGGLALLFGLLCALGARGQGRPSCEPEALADASAVSAALERSEAVARVTSDSGAAYAALCRGAAYAFLLAEPEGEQSGDLARRGFELAERARALVPGRVEAHYRYAVCLGLYLREHRLAALSRLSDLLAACRRAVELDGRYDRGGPHRILARIYAQAPRVIGPGDPAAAREHLARLLEIAGDDPENRLTAVCVHHALGEDVEARRILAGIEPEGLRGPLRVERERLRAALGE